MKKILVVAILLLTTMSAHGDHDEVKTIIPIMYEGWNLLGFSLQPYVVNDSIVSSGYDAIMYAALDDRVWYFHQTGYAIADSFVIGEGFWLKSFVDAPLIQQGIASEKRIHILYEGWNMIAYNLVYETNAANTFISIFDKMMLLKSNDGNIYWPLYNFNGIGVLLPGQGYQIKMNETVDEFYFE